MTLALPAAPRWVYGMALSRDGRELALVGEGGTVWVGPPGSSTTFVPRLTLQGGSGPCGIAFSPDGRLLATTGQNVISLWDLQTGQLVRTFKGHTRMLLGVAFLPGGRRLVSGANDGTLKLWELERGQETRTLATLLRRPRLVISPDGRLLVAGGDGMPVLWEPSQWQRGNGAAPLTLPTPGRRRVRMVLSLAFTSDSRRLLVGLGSGLELLELASDGRPAAPPILLDEPHTRTQAVAWMPDGRRFAFVEGHTLGLAEPTARHRRGKPPRPAAVVRLVKNSQAIRCLALSPDGRRLAWGDGRGTIQVHAPGCGSGCQNVPCP